MEYKWRAMNIAEWVWQQKPKHQIISAIDTCLMRSLNSKTIWARKHWHNVAQDLDEKYIHSQQGELNEHYV